MKEELFAELLDSVRQGGRILRGELKPSRAFRFEDPDVRKLRERYGLSQSKFAALMGISPATLRNWEQGRRMVEAVGADVVGAVRPEHRGYLKGETALVVGNRGEGETFPYGYFKFWKLDTNLGRFEKV